MLTLEKKNYICKEIIIIKMIMCIMYTYLIEYIHFIASSSYIYYKKCK